MKRLTKGFMICIVAIVSIFAGLFFYHLTVVNPVKEGKFGLQEGVYIKLNPVTNVITFRVRLSRETNVTTNLMAARMYAYGGGGSLIKVLYEKMSEEKNDLYALIIPYSINEEPEIDL